MDFTLRDDQGNALKGRVELTNVGGLNIRFEGYGDSATIEGSGSPLFIELYENKLQVVAWNDINDENPSHTIDLEGARESLYKNR